MKYTSKTKSDFIDGVMDSEHSVFVAGFDESILSNPWIGRMKAYKASSRLVRCSSNYIPSNQLKNMTPTDYISREEVIKIIEKGIQENMYHTSCDRGYISQEFSEALKIIESLPSLPDKSLQIREMIEKKIEFYKTGFDPINHHSEIAILQKLLDEIDLINSSKPI